MIPKHSSSLCFFFLFPFVLHTLASPTLHYCRDDQRDALLEFKHEFRGAHESSPFQTATNMSSWNKSSDCCIWDGVSCDDAKSGKVISLNLEQIFINNSLKPNSNLFKLQYLQNLTLSFCGLYGEIPSSLGNLSDLVRLDLSSNELVGQIPASIGNLTQLRFLSLTGNNLNGKIPVSFANLTKLVTLDLNSNLFESELPPYMNGLRNLKKFSVRGNSFYGPFPTSLFTMRSLEVVNLGGNKFKGSIEFGNTSSSSRLSHLDLSNNKFDGPIPESISQFLNLESLDLSYNNLTGPIPKSISDLVNLEHCDVSGNSISGPFPTSLFTISSLEYVDLGKNQLKGAIEFGNTSSSSRLSHLDLSYNKFDGPIPKSIAVAKFPYLKSLFLSYNSSIGPTPRTISQLGLDFLDLSNNKLEGKVPSSLWRLSELKLSHNSLSSFEEPSEVVDQSQMRMVYLDSNSFLGPFPHWICKLEDLQVLDLSNNSFSGSIPPCLKDITTSLEVLNLHSNNFNGILPDVFVNNTPLSALDVSRNRLEGEFPKSLINCEYLEHLNVESNKFKDKFPSWLGSLPWLYILSLRSNQFYGSLYQKNDSIGFQNIQVIDLSHNDFIGTFPEFYFSTWRAMSPQMIIRSDDYMEPSIGFSRYAAYYSFYISMKLVNKGVDTDFERIRTDFRAIDFSGNKFSGKIPESIGFLKELQLLNLSGNAFTGNIPQPLANLTNLEALDLSSNQLSGPIPRDLGTLNFLSTMDFSHNNLEGPIPRGQQFQSQNCSSFMDNPKLYGLEDICEKPRLPNPTPQEPEEVSEPEEQVISWIAATIAYVPGVFCGLVIGHIFVSHNYEWLMEKFRLNKPKVAIGSAR